jgi:hypothetical protein
MAWLLRADAIGTGRGYIVSVPDCRSCCAMEPLPNKTSRRIIATAMTEIRDLARRKIEDEGVSQAAPSM